MIEWIEKYLTGDSVARKNFLTISKNIIKGFKELSQGNYILT